MHWSNERILLNCWKKLKMNIKWAIFFSIFFLCNRECELWSWLSDKERAGETHAHTHTPFIYDYYAVRHVTKWTEIDLIKPVEKGKIVSPSMRAPGERT